jgi:subtilisin-like proprotein convertase family protein
MFHPGRICSGRSQFSESLFSRKPDESAQQTSVCALALGTSLAEAQFSFHDYSASGNVPIPSSGTGGAPGGITNPANVASLSVTVPVAIDIQKLQVSVQMLHPNVGDLRVELHHCNSTVILYNQQPPLFASVNGLYTFDDSAATSFSQAVTTAGNGGAVPEGDYQPTVPLSSFNGSNSAGTWTIRVYDLAANNTGAIFQVNLHMSGYDLFTSEGSLIGIPDAVVNGQCSVPAVKVVNVGTHGTISDMKVEIIMSHTWISDLDITLQHGGVTVAISEWNAPPSSANVVSQYIFWDGGLTPWTTAESTHTGSFIPFGTYRPKQPLSAFVGLDQSGEWYLTACDRTGQDVGTLGQVALKIVQNPYFLALTQPNGSASIDIVNYGGLPGDSFVNLFTLVQGSAPAGWILGLDIPLADVLTQVSSGLPFTGTLNAWGSHVTTVAGPIPSGLTVWGASLELDGNMIPVATKRVFSYTTQ